MRTFIHDLVKSKSKGQSKYVFKLMRPFTITLQSGLQMFSY